MHIRRLTRKSFLPLVFTLTVFGCAGGEEENTGTEAGDTTGAGSVAAAGAEAAGLSAPVFGAEVDISTEAGDASVSDSLAFDTTRGLVPVDCDPLSVLGTITDKNAYNNKRKLRSPGSRDNEILIVHTGALQVRMRDLKARVRGVEITELSGASVPATTWAHVSIDASGCNIADPRAVVIAKDGVAVPGSSYDSIWERATAPVMGNSSYVLAAPGGFTPGQPKGKQ